MSSRVLSSLQVARRYGNAYTLWLGKTPVELLNEFQAVKGALTGHAEQTATDLWHPFWEMSWEAPVVVSVVACTKILLAEQASQRMGFGTMTMSTLNASFKMSCPWQQDECPRTTAAHLAQTLGPNCMFITQSWCVSHVYTCTVLANLSYWACYQAVSRTLCGKRCENVSQRDPRFVECTVLGKGAEKLRQAWNLFPTKRIKMSKTA